MLRRYETAALQLENANINNHKAKHLNLIINEIEKLMNEMSGLSGKM